MKAIWPANLIAKTPLHSSYFKALICGLSIGLAWNFPGGIACAVLGWIGAFSLVWLLNTPGPRYLPSYLMGLLLNCVGMYWLFHTISYFGGFGLLPTTLIFSLWAIISALQFPLLALIYFRLGGLLRRCGLGAAIAWTAAEFISIRIFPWHLGHTQLGFTLLAQIADVVGSLGISFYMLWLAEAVFRMVSSKRRDLALALPLLLAPCLLFYGLTRVHHFNSADFPKQEVALVQADITVEEKHNQRLFQQNTDRYMRLTRQIADEDLLVVWPEAVVQDFIFEKVGNAALDRRLPTGTEEAGSALLIGALTFNAQRQIHNSALAIYPDGSVPTPYHKRILMPFGEYTPGLDWFPWLADIHSTPEFAAGEEIVVFEYPRKESSQPAPKIAPLICYEDVVPALSRAAAQKGANLLANLTNDAWFGNTAAPYQHNLIAAFRAIENRRYLLRATNSGLTAVISALGSNVATLPPFSEGILRANVALISERTFYNTYWGDWPWWSISIFALCIACFAHRRGSSSVDD